jgi:acetylglutamate kinase
MTEASKKKGKETEELFASLAETENQLVGVGQTETSLSYFQEDSIEKEAQETHPYRILRVGKEAVYRKERFEQLSEYIRECREADERLILVHGGEEHIYQWFQQQSRISSFTGTELDVTAIAVYALNMRLVSQLVASGHPAVSVSGVDMGWLQADFLNLERLGRIGGPPRIKQEYIHQLLDANRLPIIAPIGIAPDGLPLTFRTDMLAQILAVTLGASTLEFVIETPLLTEEVGEGRKFTTQNVASLIANHRLDGVIIPKLHASLAALNGGVETVVFGNIENVQSGNAIEIHSSL